MKKYKSVAGGVLGIIGAVLAFISAIWFVACAEVADTVSSVAGEGTNYTWAAYVLGLGGAVATIVGSVFAFKSSYVGGIIMAIALIMTIVLGVIMYFSILSIMSMVLIGLSAILCFFVKKEI